MYVTRGFVATIVWISSFGLSGCGSASGSANGRLVAAPQALGVEALAVRLEAPSGGTDTESGDSAPAGQDALAQTEVLDRAKFVRAVIARNPTAQAARQAWLAAKARRVQREGLDDPMLSYSFAPLSVGSSMRYGQTLELSQRFPWPGKLGSLGEAAQAESEVAGQRYEALKLDLALAASMLYDEYYLVARSLEVNREHQALLEQLQRSAQARYGVGRGSLQDPLQAEVERMHLMHDAIVLQARRQVTLAQMNALLHRLPNAEVPPPPADIAVSTHEPAASSVLQKRALRQRAELRGAVARAREAQARTEFARRQYYPDVTVMVSYSSMWDAVEHQFMVGVSAPIPIQRGVRGGAVDEANAMSARARQAVMAATSEIRRDVDVARARVLEALHVLRLYDEQLLPLARDRLRAARAGLEAGSNDFSAVIAAEDRLRQDQLNYQTAKAELSKRRAELARATGELPGAAAGDSR